MRPIKFRVWDKQKSQFVEDDLLFEQGEEDGGTSSIRFVQRKLDRYHGYIIQQYTGLKDKNDKEIYEGDILDIFNHPQPEEVIYSSTETAFGFFAHEDKERDNGRFEYLGDYTSSQGYTVIGNIFQNNELLK